MFSSLTVFVMKENYRNCAINQSLMTLIIDRCLTLSRPSNDGNENPKTSATHKPKTEGEQTNQGIHRELYRKNI